MTYNYTLILLERRKEMLRTSQINLRVAEATKKDKGSIINALNEIASIDYDFSGENGEEYLWEEAKGYESNMDYVSKTVDGYTPQALVYNYLNLWLGRDNYYSSYDYQVLELSDSDTLIIVVSYIIDN